MAKEDGEGRISKIAGKEGVRATVNETVNGLEEGPAQNGVDCDGVAKGDADGDSAVVGVGVWDGVGNHGA